MLLWTCLLALAVVSQAFDLLEVKPEKATVKEGSSVTLFCAVDTYWEWCKFSHVAKVCDYQWTRAAWNVTTLNCDDFGPRVEFVGDYGQKECAIKLSNVGVEDAGRWTCQLEAYHAGRYRGYGYQKTGEMFLKVEERKTTSSAPRFIPAKTTRGQSQTGEPGASTTLDFAMLPLISMTLLSMQF